MNITAPARARAPQQPAVRRVRLGLLGLGVVGQGLAGLLARKGHELAARHGIRFEIERVLVRDRDRRRDALPQGADILEDFALFRAGEYDGVVEAMGGTEPARGYVAEFLRRGVPVVTANKALLAEHGGALRALGAPLRGEAAVAAGIPLLSVLDASLQTTEVRSVTAILNGTSNYVFTRMAEGGVRLGAAVEEARRLGFAEEDPSLDLSGVDAAQKLSLLAERVGWELPLDRIETEGAGECGPRDFLDASSLGYVVKPVAHFDEGRGFAAPACVPERHPLARVDGEANGVLLRGDTIRELFLAGPGAGGIPTAASIVDDLLAIFARTDFGPPAPTKRRPSGEPLEVRRLVSLRFQAEGAGTDGVLPLVRPREVRQSREAGLPAIVATTAPLSTPELDSLLLSLRAVRSLVSVRVLRIVE